MNADSIADIYLKSIGSDFQNKNNSEIEVLVKANMTLATSWMAERFDCLVGTLEK